MTLPKKGRRKIIVEDALYFFSDPLQHRYSYNDKCLVLAVTGEVEGCQTLIFEHPYLKSYLLQTDNGVVDIQRYSSFSAIPKSFVAEVIKHYTSNSYWHPREKGKQVHAYLLCEDGICYFKRGSIPEHAYTKNISKC